MEKSEREQEGFVTVSHSLGVLKKMNRACPHIIALSNNKVIGYALCMHPKFADTIEVLKPMFQEINKTLPSLENYLVMGQICIAKDYRKQGIFRELYKTLQKNNFPSYKSIITEVDTKNTRSLSAHYSVGFEDLKGYRFKEKKWKLIILR